ncbi:MAG: NAD(P)-dependent oxidoreductase [Deltaproteobacteria bacterium]|nr:NAD(P)-dependent oxidoreductase [Deltaproteobacteria bacterium]
MPPGADRSNVLVTGSEGLIGSALARALASSGWTVRRCDLSCAGTDRVDVTDAARLLAHAHGCVGIVHLAAVSRVAWGEQRPEECWRTNVGGSANALQCALSLPQSPWVILASSREVYGQAEQLPAHEETPLAPLNVYGRAKVEAERQCWLARDAGARVAVLRLSNVYGSLQDHSDRVIPAFARAAAFGGVLRLDGPDCQFDFTHVDDAVDGIVATIRALEGGERDLPPIHLVTGRATSLRELAAMAIASGAGKTEVQEGERRDYDVSRFWGDPSRARRLLGWQAKVGIEQGVRAMVEGFARQ